MIDYLKWKILNDKEKILSKSFKHCHAKGVYSIYICDGIRIFFTSKGHELYKNNCLRIKNSIGFSETLSNLSVGFHNHHAHLKLQCLKGSLYNIWGNDKECYSKGFSCFKFDSKINGGTGGFVTYNAGFTIGPHSYSKLERDEILEIWPYEFHTIYVEPGEEAAWIVFEGKENPDYIPLCFSNWNLEKFSSEALYKPMAEDELFYIYNKL